MSRRSLIYLHGFAVLAAIVESAAVRERAAARPAFRSPVPTSTSRNFAR